jgi:hypothetical protein
MKKTFKALKKLKITDRNLKSKAHVLMRLIQFPKSGVLCKKPIVGWCKKQGFKVERYTEGNDWWWMVYIK